MKINLGMALLQAAILGATEGKIKSATAGINKYTPHTGKKQLAKAAKRAATMQAKQE